jgi:hypothetical protein
VFATAIILGTESPPTVELVHEASKTTVEIAGPPATRLVERWSGELEAMS